ncbi:MAG: YdeI/OmpD-associated family protein [Segetibacter sp.]
MIEFTATIKKFDKQGDKTGWTYIEIPAVIALQLNPQNKKSFRVKGFLDKYSFAGISLLPLGSGNFIMALNATIRKHTGKGKGANLEVKMEADRSPVLLSTELMQCLSDEPIALAFFNKLQKSHQNYYSKWIESAKTEATKAKRIAQTVTACLYGQHYGEMMRSLKKDQN